MEEGVSDEVGRFLTKKVAGDGGKHGDAGILRARERDSTRSTLRKKRRNKFHKKKKKKTSEKKQRGDLQNRIGKKRWFRDSMRLRKEN